MRMRSRGFQRESSPGIVASGPSFRRRSVSFFETSYLISLEFVTMVSLLHLHVCCGGFNTRVGSIIIGVLCMVAGVFVILGSTLKLSQSENVSKSHTFQITHAGSDLAKWGNVVQMIVAIIDTIISGLMVWGAIKKICKFVYAWIILNLVYIALITFLLVSMAIFYIVKGRPDIAYVFAITECIYFAFHGYLVLVVHSFHTTLKSGTEDSPFEMRNTYHHPKEQDMA